MLNHRTIIEMWPKVEVLAADLDLKPRTVWSWKTRNSIPVGYFKRLLKAARERKIYVTHTDLVDAASIERRAA